MLRARLLALAGVGVLCLTGCTPKDDDYWRLYNSGDHAVTVYVSYHETYRPVPQVLMPTYSLSWSNGHLGGCLYEVRVLDVHDREVARVGPDNTCGEDLYRFDGSAIRHGLKPRPKAVVYRTRDEMVQQMGLGFAYRADDPYYWSGTYPRCRIDQLLVSADAVQLAQPRESQALVASPDRSIGLLVGGDNVPPRKECVDLLTVAVAEVQLPG